MKLIRLTQYRKEKGETVEKPFLLNADAIATVRYDNEFFQEGEIPILDKNYLNSKGEKVVSLLTTRNNDKFVVKESLEQIEIKVNKP